MQYFRSCFQRHPAAAAALVLASLASLGCEAQAATTCTTFAAINGMSSPAALTAPDGSVWYTVPDRLIRIGNDINKRQAQGVVPVDAATQRLSGIAIGADGALWFSKDSSARIGRLPLDGAPGAEYAVPGARFVRGLRAGAQQLWFYDPVIGIVGSIGLAGDVQRYPGPKMGPVPFAPSGLAVDASGAVWVSVTGHNAIYRLDPERSAWQRFDIASPGAQPGEMLAAADGSVWFTMPAVAKIGHWMPGGEITEISTAPDAARYLAIGPDGALWYTAPTGSWIGRIGPDAAVTRLRCGQNAGAMTVGPDGQLWAIGNGQIAVVGEGAAPVLAAVQPALPAPATPAAAPSRVEEVASDALAGRLRSLPGSVVVQFTSFDPNCTFCVPANPAFDKMAARHPEMKFLRVRYEPWKSIANSASARSFKINGLPTTLGFEAGQETSRVLGQLPAEKP